MSDFSTNFGTGFEIGAIIKEKKVAKKAMEEAQTVLEEWRMSGKEPSYVDKLMLGLTASKVGENYSRIFGDITNNKDSYDKEKMSQSAINLREYNAQVLNFVKMIQTSAKEGTLDLIPWDSVQTLMPDVDLTKVLNSIPELKNKQYEAKTKEQNIDIYGKTPTDIRQGVGEQLGVIPEGVQPTTEAITDEKKADTLSKIYNAKNEKLYNVYAQKWGLPLYQEATEKLSTRQPTATETKVALGEQYGASKEDILNYVILGKGAGGGTTTPTSYKTLQDIKDSFKNVKTKAEYDEALATYNSSKEAQTSDWTPPPFGNQLTNLIKKVESALWSDYVNKDGKLKSKTDADEYNTRLQYYLNLIEEAKKAGVDVSVFQAFKPYKSLYGGMGNPLVTSESW